MEQIDEKAMETVRALKNLAANIETGNVDVDNFDADTLTPETIRFYLELTVKENRQLNLDLQ